MKRLVLTDASVGGVNGCRIVLEDGLIAEINRAPVPGPKGGAIDVAGGAVISGLWDHHVHLFATAARGWSIDVAQATNVEHFKEMVSVATRQDRDGVRVVGYDDDVLGPLNGDKLDRMIPTQTPIKVQHRSGHQWVLNTAARQLRNRAGGMVDEDGILWDQDPSGPSDPQAQYVRKAVRELAQGIAANGCVGVTDMSATSGHQDIVALRSLLEPMLLLEAYGAPDRGLDAVKRIASDHSYPDPDEVAIWVRPGRGKVALHTVTAETLALVASAGSELGPHVRLEHAFMASLDLLSALGETGVELGVHPGFIHSHGDRILRRLPEVDVLDYQRLESMRKAGFRMFGGTDQPYAPGSIWRCMEAAVTRRTRAGAQLGTSESLTPEEALALFTPHGLQGEAAPPTLSVGRPADICVMDRDWNHARSALSQVRVSLTVAAGKLTWASSAADRAAAEDSAS